MNWARLFPLLALQAMGQSRTAPEQVQDSVASSRSLTATRSSGDSGLSAGNRGRACALVPDDDGVSVAVAYGRPNQRRVGHTAQCSERIPYPLGRLREALWNAADGSGRPAT
jgi:hypothetical protein